MMRMIGKARLDAILSTVVSVHPHETSALLHSSSCFFFILSAYFVVLPLRDEGAISLGLSKLPGLFVGSLLLTLVAAPLSSLLFFFPSLSKSKALLLIHRFFSISLVFFFVLWHSSTADVSLFKSKGTVSISTELKADVKGDVSHTSSASWSNHGWYYVSVRIGLFLWVALLNLITISSTWARIIDVMDTESGSRLFGFIGAGATLGQLFGSLFATVMAWMGPYLLLFAAMLMELAAQSSKGINKDISNLPEELAPIRNTDFDEKHENGGGHNAEVPKSPMSAKKPKSPMSAKKHENGGGHNTKVPKSPMSAMKPQLSAMLEGFWLIYSSTYLLYVALFLWLSAVVSSFFYFQKVTVISMTVTASLDRRKLFAQINSFIAVFILAGQLTLTGRILAVAGVTIAISATPAIAFANLVAVAVWPNWVAIAICETVRKVITYVMTRPGRELLFTVVSQDEKYKAKVCIDVIVQRLGDATAAGMYKLLFNTLRGKTASVSLYALPVCILWIITALHLGRRQAHLAKFQAVQTS